MSVRRTLFSTVGGFGKKGLNKLYPNLGNATSKVVKATPTLVKVTPTLSMRSKQVIEKT